MYILIKKKTTMESDRYQQNSKLFIIGILCLFGSIACIGFGLYIAPPLFWGIHYAIPEFPYTAANYLQEEYHLTAIGSIWLVFLSFIVPGLLMGLIAYLISNRIDNAIYHIEPESRPETETEDPLKLRESTGLGLKVIGLMVIMLILIFLLQWLITG
jgi:hypothetical protein